MTEYPERALWQSVIITALQDACNPLPVNRETRRAKDEAAAWLARGGKRFREVCQWAGFDPDFIRDAYLSGRIKALNLYPANKMTRKRKLPTSGDCVPALPGSAGCPVPSIVTNPQGSDRPCGVEGAV